MKNKLLLSLIFISLNTFSQDYQDICSPGKTIFTTSDVKYAAFRLDSARFLSGDSVYYSYPAFRDTTTDYFYPSCVDTTMGSVLGRKVIRHTDGTFNFFNRNNDTIILKTTFALDQAWRIFSLQNSNYLEAKVTGKSLESFLGVNDTVKTITLQAKDQSGNPINHPMNGKLIKLSKSYGLAGFYDVYQFPDNTAQYALAGKSHPQLGFQEPKVEEIYDWPVGATFHYQDHEGSNKKDDSPQTGRDCAGGSLMRPPHWHVHTYLIKTILSKSVTPDSVTYHCHLCSIQTYGPNSGYEDTTKQEFFQTETYKFDSLESYLDKLPDEYNPLGHLSRLQVCDVNNAPAKLIKESYYQHSSCWWHYYFISPYNMPLDSVQKAFSKNLGITEMFTYSFNNGNEWRSQHHLVYFSCDTLTWGTPVYLDCSLLLSVKTTKNSIPAIRFAPNPVETFATVTIEGIDINKGVFFYLYDLSGRKIKCQPVRNNSFIFDREGVICGLYFYSLTDPDGRRLLTGKVMVK